MRLPPEYIKKLSKFIFKKLQEKDLIEPLVKVGQIILKIEEVITKNMMEEAAIDQTAKKMMAQFESQIRSGQADEQKLFTMVKKQIAKDKKFIL